MTKPELIDYWVDTANSDYKTATHLFESKDYAWSLFIGHLVIEKLLKAVYIQNIGEIVPKTHDLYKLAIDAGANLEQNFLDSLDLITSFNLNARYPDYKQRFYAKCTKEYTYIQFNLIKELRLCLMQQLNRTL